MKTILILLDTVRKHELAVYNSQTTTKTPNITNLANEATIFENHCTGSLPCMPARRDLLTGRLDFFERFWGSIEPFDQLWTNILQQNNVTCHLETDHHHYFAHGGEGYVQSYSTFNFHRGQESDKWISQVDQIIDPAQVHGRYNQQFLANATQFTTIDDYPTIKTFNSAINYLEQNYQKDDFVLQIEGFDPHEPFYTPQEFLDLYELNELPEMYISPTYGKCIDTPEQLNHLKKRYQANLSFADYALGKLIDKLKALNIYDECNIIFTSDHGFHLGEHGVVGKGVGHVYNEVSEIPLIVKTKNQKEAKRIDRFTQNIDIMPTLLELYGIDIPDNLHGKSLLPLINNSVSNWRNAVVSGYHGQSVMIKNEKYTYYRAPIRYDNMPLYTYTAMPVTIRGYLSMQHPFMKLNLELIENGRFLTHTRYPVYKIPMASYGRKSPMYGNIFTSELYLNSDQDQQKQIIDIDKSREMERELQKIMKSLSVPQEQYLRLGLIGDDNE